MTGEGERLDEKKPPAASVDHTSESRSSGAEATAIGVSTLSLDEEAKDQLGPTTPTTIEAATTGSASDPSLSPPSGQGVDEGTSIPEEKPRQVIAVSVSKGPSAFFNLARKFLVTDEVCDLSALEGAIVSAVDAAHLLERSKIATIVQIQTSYVAVEPKKRREDHFTADTTSNSAKDGTGATSVTTGSPSRQPQAIDTSSKVGTESGSSRIDTQPGTSTSSSASQPDNKSKSSTGTMRRARIVITVKRTEAYEKWLKDNPIQGTQAGHDEDHI